MKRIILSVAALFALSTVSAQEVALSTNVLTLPFSTINVGAEFTLSSKWTLATDVTLPIVNIWGDYDYNSAAGLAPSEGEYNAFYANGWMAFTEGRYWFCEAFNRHHIGAYLGAARLGTMQIDGNFFGVMLSSLNKGKLEDGTAGMLGVSYGYYMKFYHGWGLDLYVGVGAIYGNYIKEGATEYDEFFGFTLSRLGVALSYKF